MFLRKHDIINKTIFWGKKMNIFVRNDLNMRKGKITSQVAHAVVGLWLGAMDKSEDKFILKGDNYEIHKKWVLEGLKINIVPVNSEGELLFCQTNNTVLIKDHGRTEFKEPTYTCLSEFNNIVLNKKVVDFPFSDKQAKQTLIANRELSLNKWILAVYAGRASWSVLLDKMEDTGNELILNLDEEGLRNWLLGAFAKITLKIEECDIQDLKTKLSDSNVLFHEERNDNRIVILATEPRLVEVINNCTSELKLY